MKNDEKKLVYFNKGKDVNIVMLDSEYDTNCSEQKYEIVNDETLAYMLEYNRAMGAWGRKNRRKTIPKGFDEGIVSEKLIVINTVEYQVDVLEEYRTEMSEVLRIVNLLTQCQRKRIYMIYKLKMSYKQIGEIEGVGISSIQKSCELGIEKLKPYSQYLQSLIGIKWVDLLI